MGVTIPNASMMNWFKMTGTTSELSPRGHSADYREFVVTKPGEFNLKINNTYTNVKIVNQRNEVVAEMKSGHEAADTSAKLAPGTYKALIEQQFKGDNGRAYDLEFSVRSNTMLLANGALLKGQARPPLGPQDSGVQKHTLNVVQGGEFTADFSLKGTRWAVMSKDGKVVASGDTMQPDKEINDILKKPSFKFEPGQYEVVIVTPRDTRTETPFQLNFVAKTAQVDMPVEEREIDKVLREREARLRRWASEDAGKPQTRKV